MVLDWSTIQAHHVTKAGELLLRGHEQPRAKAKVLFVLIEGKPLPAKHVLRLAYCLANKLPLESAPKFASGEGTIKVLQRLGFSVERTTVTKGTQDPILGP